MSHELRYAFRQLLKNPAFTLIAALTLALGIGANTAIFSVVEGTLLRPLPFPKADRLVRVYEAGDENGVRSGSMNMSERTVRQWMEHGGDIFEGLAAAAGVNITLGANDGNAARSIPATRVTPNFFSVIGLSPAIGRSFTAEEAKPGATPVVIVSDDFVRQFLGGRPDVLSSTVVLDGVAHTIIGVMPKAFRHPYRADLWLPLSLAPLDSGQPANHYLYGVARLRDGISIRQASDAVRRMCRDINAASPDPLNARAAYLPPLRDSFVLDLRPKLLVIAIAALCALLIAAANFAGLLLTRVTEREGEFALRAALGASSMRLARQQLTQAIVLTIVGTLGGLLVAYWITPLLVAMSPEGSDMTGSAMREFDYAVRFDWPVFAFTAAVMLIVGLGFGLLPALRASRADMRVAINSTARGSTLDRSTRRILGSFVIVQLAVAAALLIASLAAAQYFRELVNEPWGFSTDHRTAFDVTFSERLFPSPAAKEHAIEAILDELKGVAGVKTATVTGPSPMNAPRDLVGFNVEGASPPEPQDHYLSYLRATVPGYFNAMDERLVQGRDFSAKDDNNSPPVCIVSQSFARRFWPNDNAVGKRVKWGRFDGPRPWMTVVGVVGDIKAIADPNDGEVIGMIVRPLSQLLATSNYQMDEITFVVQTETAHGPIEAAIRQAIGRAEPRVAAYQIVSLDEAAAQSRMTERFVLVLVSLFGGLGLVLSAVGLYGLLSLHVARRQREIGIRSALGASARQIVHLIARQSAILIAVGLVAGGGMAWAVVRLVRNQWSAMPTPNVLSWLAAAAVLSAAALVACWIPARRAVNIDPVIALRAD